MKKIAIISPNFTEQRFCERWIQFANKYSDYEVYLLIPNNRKVGYQKEYSFGTIRKDQGYSFSNGQCHGEVFNLKYHKFISWTSENLVEKLCVISPDIIYYIGLHNQESIVQLIHGKNKYLKNTRVILFSMRGPQHCLIKPTDKNLLKRLVKYMLWKYEKIKQSYIYKNIDAICCHYPEAVELFKQEGFKKDIYVQTQIGVNSAVYKNNQEARRQIRKRYNLSERDFVFGCAVRFAKEKGVFVILNALTKVNAKLLLMGAGNQNEEDEIDKIICENNLKDKVIKTGFITGDDMAQYWNAVDCALHVPLSTKNWIETFSLAVVQAMSVGNPIIGSDSGSVPYQIGYKELIVPEGNADLLAEKMNWILLNPDIRKLYAQKVHQRTKNKFDIQVLNSEMYNICEAQLARRKSI